MTDDGSLGFNNNPSRQSERSRFNNQDYQTYTPPSIIKDISYKPGQLNKLRRRASVSFRPDHAHTCEFLCKDDLFPSGCHYRDPIDRFRPNLDGGIFPSDLKVKLNRRKSFHDVSTHPERKFTKQERRKSVLDRPEKWQSSTGMSKLEVLMEHQTNENPETARKKSLEKSGILVGPDNRCSRAGLNVSFDKEALESTPGGVYVYDTPARKRNLFLPEISSKIYDRNNAR
ncbi:hypothetical protein RUM44_006835 [Polyplax serrata]|uniref:Uncharacterized protein n=1 Tax=Polyplax serrata TaxID=468196 RepID=A0ABR1AJ95_POLSC